jgi:hypothetical protein
MPWEPCPVWPKYPDWCGLKQERMLMLKWGCEGKAKKKKKRKYILDSLMALELLVQDNYLAGPGSYILGLREKHKKIVSDKVSDSLRT